MGAFGEAAVEVLLALESGGETRVISGVRGVFVGAARRVASRLGERFTALLERKAVEIGAKLVEAFLTGAAREVIQQLRQSRSHSWSEVHWDRVMAKGASKAVDKFFSEAFDQFTEVFRAGWASVFNQDDADAYLRYLRSFHPDVGRYLAGKFVELSLFRPVQMIVQSFVEATAWREGEPAGYQERVYGLLMDKLRDELPGNPREAGEAMLSAFKDVAGGRFTAEASGEFPEFAVH